MSRRNSSKQKAARRQTREVESSEFRAVYEITALLFFMAGRRLSPNRVARRGNVTHGRR